MNIKPTSGAFVPTYIWRIIWWWLPLIFILGTCTSDTYRDAGPSCEAEDPYYYAMSLSRDGRQLVVSTCEGMFLHDMETYAEVWFKRTQFPASRLDFAPAGNRFASIVGSQVTLWDAQSGRKLRTVNQEDVFRDVRFSPDGARLAVADNRFQVTIWDTELRKTLGTGQVDIEMIMGLGSSWSVAWTPDGQTLAGVLTFPYPEMITWDIETGGRSQINSGIYCARVLEFNSDGTLLASGELDVVIWDVDTGQQRYVVRDTPPVASSLAWSSDGKQLFVGISDGTVNVWDINENEQQRTFRVLADPLLFDGLALLPDGTTLVALSWHEIVVWDINTEERLHTFRRQ